jgi:hypothetical protein
MAVDGGPRASVSSPEQNPAYGRPVCTTPEVDFPCFTRITSAKRPGYTVHLRAFGITRNVISRHPTGSEQAAELTGLKRDKIPSESNTFLNAL